MNGPSRSFLVALLGLIGSISFPCLVLASTSELLIQRVEVGGFAQQPSAVVSTDTDNEEHGAVVESGEEMDVLTDLEERGNVVEEPYSNGNDVTPEKPEEIAALAQVVRRWRDRGASIVADPAVSASAAVATLAAAAAGITLAGASVGSVIKLLFQALTEPFRGLAMRRHKQWGVVRNALTNQPVDLATVRLVDKESGAAVRSFVTDKKGRYLFRVKAGSYVLSVGRDGYEPYTSRPLEHAQGDGDGVVEQLLHDNVNLDPAADVVMVAGMKKPVNITLTTQEAWANATHKEQAREDRKIRRSVYVKRFWSIVSWIGPLVSIVMLALYPSWLLLGLLALHLVLFWLFRKVAHAREGNTWGRVLSARSRRPIGGAVVRLFDKKHGRLLLSQLSDGTGRYAFLVGDGDYLISGSKDGYERPKTASTVKQSGGVVAQDLGLRKAKR